MKLTTLKLQFFCGSLLALVTPAVQAQFTTGDLVVLQAGNGGALSSAGAPLFLDQFDTTTPGQTVTPFVSIPSGGTGLVLSGSATSEGELTRSSDGSILTFGGYAAAAGTSSVASGTAPREVGSVNNAGTFSVIANSSTAMSGNNIRGAVSDGQNYWITSPSGVFYQPVSSSTLTTVSSGTNARVANIFNSTLYYSTASGTARGIYAYTGTPTGTVTSSLLIGTGASSSPYDFFINGNTAYIADDSGNATGGIQRWDFNGSSWALTYTIGTGVANVGARQFTVDTTTAGGPTIYATTAETSANRLISVKDVGSAAADAATLVTLGTSPTGEIFRGVDFAPVVVPEPSSLGLSAMGLAVLFKFARRDRKS
jgi:hypothetical protein